MPIARMLNQDLFKAWSPEMAYILGYFAADGSMIVHKNGGHYIEFTSTDRELLEHVQFASGSGQRISVRPVRNSAWKQQYILRIGSKEWFQDLLLWGFTPRKSHTLAFPLILDAHLGHFVRGYFDGDGCVYFNKLKYRDRTNERWILLTLFTSGSRGFLIELHRRLKLSGLKGGSLATKERGHELKFSHRDSLALYRLMYNTGPISNLYLPRKREKLERAIQVLGLDK